MSLSVVVADDDADVRSALCAALEADPRFSVVAIVDSGPAAVAAVVRERPAAALLDVRMPGGGVEALGRSGRPGWLWRSWQCRRRSTRRSSPTCSTPGREASWSRAGWVGTSRTWPPPAAPAKWCSRRQPPQPVSRSSPREIGSPCPGSQNRTVVPPPGVRSSRNHPPATAAWSAIVTRPRWPGAERTDARSTPTPSSAITISSPPCASRMVTLTRDAAACWQVLLSACLAIRTAFTFEA